MGETSLFRVGDDVELWRVLLHLSVLVTCLLMFEHVLHLLERHAAVSAKYQQLLSKAYRELMILGLIGLGLKVVKEVSTVDGSSATMTAFQVADLTIFILALALIMQAVCIFLVLRKHNVQADRAELLSTGDLADVLASSFNQSRHTQELVQLRLLRHLFITRFQLPQLFPFAKYLRQAQNNQITHMTDVSALMWALLLGVAWVLQGIITALTRSEPSMTSRRGLVIVMIGFSWALLALHAVVFVYFRSCARHLLEAAGMAADQFVLESHLRSIGREEAQAWTQEDASRALIVMQKVQEQHESSRHRNRRGFKENQYSVKSEMTSAIEIRWFSRRSWHFTVMMLLMLNGFYLALIVQCVVYQLGVVYSDLGLVEVLVIPLPVALNTFFLQPQIFRSFVLVSSIFHVDGITLTEVINHFREIIELRSEFAVLLWQNMQTKNLSIGDLRSELEFCDPNQSGAIDVEKMRVVLRICGLHLSRFRFNSVARLLFELRDVQIEYAQLLKLVTIAQTEDLNDNTEQSMLAHHHPLLRQSVLSEEGGDEDLVIAGENCYLPPHPLLANSASLPPPGPVYDLANECIGITRATTDVQLLHTRPQLKRNGSKFQGMSSRTLCDIFHLETTRDPAIALEKKLGNVPPNN